jgi:hypothetical protein
MRDSDTCIALVSNRAYLRKALLTIWEVRLFGKYRGDVVLVVGDDLKDLVKVIGKSRLRIIPVYFPDIDRSQENRVLDELPGATYAQRSKSFQFHKFFCFSTFFKQWEKVLYLDAYMKIFAPLTPVLKIDCANSIVAHSDGHPTYEWTLADQFNFSDFPDLLALLSTIVNLSVDYFQTGMMYYDTSIIDEKTLGELIDLSQKFPNSRTNEQGILNIWAQRKSIWTKLPVERHGRRFLYDYCERKEFDCEDYIMLKYPRAPEKDLYRLLSLVAFAFFWSAERKRMGV